MQCGTLRINRSHPAGLSPHSRFVEVLVVLLNCRSSGPDELDVVASIDPLRAPCDSRVEGHHHEHREVCDPLVERIHRIFVIELRGRVAEIDRQREPGPRGMSLSRT